jgi:hypothetical protein
VTKDGDSKVLVININSLIPKAAYCWFRDGKWVLGRHLLLHFTEREVQMCEEWEEELNSERE